MPRDGSVTLSVVTNMSGALTTKTYADCVRLGGLVYAAGALLPILLIGPVMVSIAPNTGPVCRELFKVAFVTVPAAGVLGCAVTSEFFVAAVSPQRLESVWVWWVPAIWVLSLIVFPPLLIFAPFLYAAIHRQRMLASKVPIWDVAFIYAGLAILLAGLTLYHRMDVRVLLWALSALSPFGSDIVVANLIVNFRSQGRLEIPTARRFQFSLRTLLTLVWMLGAYVTALILLLRD